MVYLCMSEIIKESLGKVIKHITTYHTIMYVNQPSNQPNNCSIEDSTIHDINNLIFQSRNYISPLWEWMQDYSKHSIAQLVIEYNLLI